VYYKKAELTNIVFLRQHPGNISPMKEIFLPEDALSTELLSFLKTAIILSLYNIKVLLFTRSVL
jgi:hypothetical protein